MQEQSDDGDGTDEDYAAPLEVPVKNGQEL